MTILACHHQQTSFAVSSTPSNSPYQGEDWAPPSQGGLRGVKWSQKTSLDGNYRGRFSCFSPRIRLTINPLLKKHSQVTVAVALGQLFEIVAAGNTPAKGLVIILDEGFKRGRPQRL